MLWPWARSRPAFSNLILREVTCFSALALVRERGYLPLAPTVTVVTVGVVVDVVRGVGVLVPAGVRVDVGVVVAVRVAVGVTVGVGVGGGSVIARVTSLLIWARVPLLPGRK